MISMYGKYIFKVATLDGVLMRCHLKTPWCIIKVGLRFTILYRMRYVGCSTAVNSH